MPAYRSSAEGEVRGAVVARLRQIRPNARIMHEVNASAFGNRIDVLAVDRAEIIAVEIKSAKDKLDRLDEQVKAMKGVAHHVIAAIHEKFYVEHPTNPWRSEYEREGQHYCLLPPDNRLVRGYTFWRFPEHPKARWDEPGQQPMTALPAKALDMLWRDELQMMCHRFELGASSRATVGYLTRALRWQLSGRDLTLGICAALRQRECIEADDPIQWRDAA